MGGGQGVKKGRLWHRYVGSKPEVQPCGHSREKSFVKINQGSHPMETFTWAFLADGPNLQMIAPYSEKFSGVPLMKMDPIL